MLAMEITSPSSGSPPASHEASEIYDELYMQESILFSDCLKDLNDLRSQLYSAAEYFELSYDNDEEKPIVVDTLKDYAIKALVNTVDHLGSITCKVDGILNEKVDEVSEADLLVSCIEQRLRTCRYCIDCAGLSQQSLAITTPKYHKRYILPVGESMPESGRHAREHNLEFHVQDEDTHSRLFRDAVRTTMKERTPSFRKGRLRSRSPSLRARSSSPSRRKCSPSPSPLPRKLTFQEKRSSSAFPDSNRSPLLRSESLSVRPTLSSSPSMVQRFPVEIQKSSSMHMNTERDDHRELEKASSKTNGFLKSLLGIRKTKKDDVMLYTYLDEY